MKSPIPSCRPSSMASSRMLMAICQIFRSASGPSLFRNERAGSFSRSSAMRANPKVVRQTPAASKQHFSGAL